MDQPSLKSDEVKKQIDGSAYNDTMAAVLAKHSGSGSGSGSNVSEAQVLLKWAVREHVGVGEGEGQGAILICLDF